MLRSYQQIMLGEPHARSVEFTGLSGSEKVVLIAVAAVIILTGVYPKPILNVAQPALENILAQIQDIY
jgi:NADH-quinone oxidoreductase subunit M